MQRRKNLGSNKRKPVAERMNGGFFLVPAEETNLLDCGELEHERLVPCPRGKPDSQSCYECDNLRLFMTDPYVCVICSPFTQEEGSPIALLDGTFTVKFGDCVVAYSKNPQQVSQDVMSFLYNKAHAAHH